MKWSFLLLITILMTRTPVDAQGNASLSHKPTSISLSDELKTLYDIADLPVYRQHTVEEQYPLMTLPAETMMVSEELIPMYPGGRTAV